MELALMLILAVFINCVITIWLLAQHKHYLVRLADMEKTIDYIRDLQAGKPANPAEHLLDVADIVSTATPEELAQAQKLIDALGLKGE